MDPATSPDGGAAVDNLFSTGAAPAAGAAPDTPAATPAADWAWTDKDGKLSPGWLDKAGFKDDPTLSTIPDISTLAKAYKETKSMVGKKLSPPSETSTPEQVAEWRKLMGAPEKVEDYGSLMPDKFPAEMWDGEIEKEAVALAHKHHMTPAALKEFAALQAKGATAVYEREFAANQARLAAGKAELAAEWGDQLERRITEAKRVAKELKLEETDDIFSTRPDIVKKLAEAIRFFEQDRQVTGTAVTVSGSPEERLKAIQASPDYNGHNGDAKVKEAQAKMYEIMDEIFAARSGKR